MESCRRLSTLLLLIVTILVLLTSGRGSNVTSGYPDWTRAIALIGQDPDGNLVLIQVDADGQLTVPFKGEHDGDLMTVALDADGRMIARMVGFDGTFARNVAVDTGGQIIMVPRGQSGNYMAIDASGYMTAVLKGLYGAELRTIGLDDDGRISGYLVDAEDQWGEILKVGSAEQAARLGSVVSWDRRGQVQHVFNFDRGFYGLQAAPDGFGSTVTLNPVYWQSGGYSVQLYTVAHTFTSAYLGGRIGTSPSAKYGLSVAWASADSPDFLYLGIKHYAGTVKQEARLMFDDGLEKLYYYDSNGDYVEIADLHLDASVYSWHNMKLVVDFDDGVYVRVLVNSVEHTLSAAVKTDSVPAGGEFLLYRFHVDGYDALASTTYLDNMIFTVNEP